MCYLCEYLYKFTQFILFYATFNQIMINFELSATLQCKIRTCHHNHVGHRDTQAPVRKVSHLSKSPLLSFGLDTDREILSLRRILILSLFISDFLNKSSKWKLSSKLCRARAVDAFSPTSVFFFFIYDFMIYSSDSIARHQWSPDYLRHCRALSRHCTPRRQRLHALLGLHRHRCRLLHVRLHHHARRQDTLTTVYQKGVMVDG